MLCWKAAAGRLLVERHVNHVVPISLRKGLKCSFSLTWSVIKFPAAHTTVKSVFTINRCILGRVPPA